MKEDIVFCGLEFVLKKKGMLIFNLYKFFIFCGVFERWSFYIV